MKKGCKAGFAENAGGKRWGFCSGWKTGGRA